MPPGQLGGRSLRSRASPGTQRHLAWRPLFPWVSSGYNGPVRKRRQADRTAKSLLVLEDGSREPQGFGIRETTQSTLGRKSEDRRVGKSMGGPEAHRVGWVTEAKCPQGPLHTHRLVLGAMRAPDLQALPQRREPWGSLAPRQPGWARGCKGTASLCRQCPQVSANGDTPAIHAALPRPSRVLRTPVPSECSRSKSPLSALLRDNLRNSGVLKQTPFQSILFHFTYQCVTRPNRSTGREKVVVPVHVKVRRVVLKGTCKTPPMGRRLMRAPGTAAALLPGCWGGGVWTLPSPGGRLSRRGKGGG